MKKTTADMTATTGRRDAAFIRLSPVVSFRVGHARLHIRGESMLNRAPPELLPGMDADRWAVVDYVGLIVLPAPLV